MHISPEGKFIRTDIWHEGKYLDLWSVPHLLSGITLALIMHFLGFAAVPTFVVAFLIFVTYEMFEVIVKIEETRMNRILDVVVGMVSFIPTFLLAPRLTISQALALLVIVGVINAVLSSIGWWESQKAAVFERKLRAEITERRIAMKRRRSERKRKRRERRLKKFF